MQLSVRVNIDEALRKFQLVEEDVKSALPRALNKTATTARAQAAREIRDVGYGIKVSAVKAAITIQRATRAQLRAIVRASGRPIPLVQYGATQNKSGVAVKVLNGRTTIKGAFIATMPSGHKGVYVRVDDAQAKASLMGRAVRRFGVKAQKKHGLPIRELFGPSIPAAFKNEVVFRATVEAIAERFPTVLAHELHYVQMKSNQ